MKTKERALNTNRSVMFMMLFFKKRGTELLNSFILNQCYLQKFIQKSVVHKAGALHNDNHAASEQPEPESGVSIIELSSVFVTFV